MRSKLSFRFPRLPSIPPALVAVRATIVVVVLSSATACTSGIRFVITPGAEATTEAGNPIDTQYWVLYQDWRISHRDLLRDLDRNAPARSSFEKRFSDVETAFEQLAPHVPAAHREVFESARERYAELRTDAERGLNRSIVRQRLLELGALIQEKLNPDDVAALQAESSKGSSGEADPASETGESSGSGDSRATDETPGDSGKAAEDGRERGATSRG